MANILVIDNEEVLLNLIAAVLRLDGHNVSAVRHPSMALDSLDAGRAAIDLILADMCAKPSYCLDLMNRLHERGFDGAVIFMSGYIGLARAVAKSGRYCEILEKPFTARELRASVGGALRQSTPRLPLGGIEAGMEVSFQ